MQTEKNRFKERLKIGIIANEFLPNYGGMESYAENIAKVFIDKGIDVHLFTRVDASDLTGAICHKFLIADLKHDIKKFGIPGALE